MSTLEILIAFAIFTLSITAVIMTAFGNQSSIIDTELHTAALSIAQEFLEEERVLAKKDFKLANPTTTDSSIGSLAYTASVAVSQLGYSTKQATSTVTWQSGGRAESVDISTLFTNSDLDDDTCSSVVSGDWSNLPSPLPSFTLSSVPGVPPGVYTISDIDAYNGRLYVAAAKTTNATDPTLFVFDISTPTTPSLIGMVDNAPSTKEGLSAVRVAKDVGSGRIFAYAANAHNANYSTCSVGPSCAELQIIDVSTPAALLPSSFINYKLPGVTGSSALGNSIFYKKGYVYLGLTSTAGNGPEFHVLDVHTPTVPGPAGAYGFGHDVNAITVRGSYAYVATPATEELTVLSAPTPAYIGGFNVAGAGGNGKSVYVVGDTLYVGKTTNAKEEYYALDASDLTHLHTDSATPKRDVASSLNALVARDYLAFLLTNTELQVINATSSALLAHQALPVGGSSFEPSLDCEGNVLYISSNDVSNNGTLSIVTPS